MDFLTAAYPWIKVLHLFSLISWMVSLLYMPRLFVYHADTPAGSPGSETFKVMERKLARGIMLPAMIATILFGGMLAGIPGIVEGGTYWFPVKIILVFGLLGFQHLLAKWRRGFEHDANRHTARFYRMVNEIPAVLLIGILIMVLVKPF